MARTQRINTRWLARGGLRHFGLSMHEGWVLLAIIDRANEDGIAWPSQYRLASDLGIARSTVQAALTRLLEVGALSVHEQGRQGLSTRYRVPELPSQLARQPGQLVAVN